jgi:glyoxylase-like metal-dependent hydrolase (beta-lactamase superfamily II)
VTRGHVTLVVAPNPGPFTLEGTNTWIVGAEPALVIDPGPDHRPHLEAVLERAGRVGAVLLTHHHPDHAEGAATIGRMAGAPIMAGSPIAGEQPLEDGMVVDLGGVAVRVVVAPGHTPDHVVFFEPETRALFTGDTVLGRGTSVIDPPEGDLGAYLRSLRALLALEPEIIYPGHGPIARPATAKLNEYLKHREERERQVLDALRDGPRAPEEIVPSIYAVYPAELYPAAARSVLAHLLKLEAEELVVRVPSSTDRFGLVEVRGGHTDGQT